MTTRASAAASERDTPPPVYAWSALPPWMVPVVRERVAARATWPHALLLAGAAGIGKRAVALHMAQALLCETPHADGMACTTCASCRYVAAGQHPDLRVLEPWVIDDDGDVKQVEDIAVDRVRELRSFLGVSSHRGGNRVALIVPAERMNTAAANALLKTLEEPPAGSFLLLVTHQPGRLLPTIVSRCRRMPLTTPPRDEALAWLRAQGVDDATSVLAQANGAPLTALVLAAPNLQAERAAWLAALADPATLSAPALSARVEAGGRDDRKLRLAAAVDWLIAWSTDLAAVTAGASPRRNPDFAAPLAALAPQVARISLSRYHRSLLQRRRLLSHPLTPRLVAEAMLLDYQALFTSIPNDGR